MTLKTTLGVAALALAAGGCTTIGMSPVSKPDLPDATDKDFLCADRDACKPADARRALAAALNYCAALSAYYDRNGGVTTGQRLFIGVAGSLAGSVFALTAGGTAAKAWSGFSGAANGLQTQLDNAADRIGNAARQQTIAQQVTEVQGQIDETMLKDRPDEVMLRARFLVSRCATAASATSAPAPAPEASGVATR